MTPEGRVKAAIKRVLKAHGCWWYMPVPGGFGEPTLDFICAIDGRIFCIEAKAPGKKPTPRQQETMRRYEEKGVPCIVIDGDTGPLVELITTLGGSE